MLKQYAGVFSKISIFFDLAIVSFSFLLGSLISCLIYGFSLLHGYLLYLPFILILWGVLLNYFGMYESFRIKRVLDAWIIAGKASIFGFFGLIGFMYIFHIHIADLNRLSLFFGFILTILILGIEKTVQILFLRFTRKKGYNYRNIIIFGTGRRAQDFVKVVNSHPEWGLKIVGLMDDDASRVGEVLSGYRILGTFNDAQDIFHNNVIDEAIFIVPRSWLARIEGIMNICDTEGIRINLAVDYFHLQFSRAKIAEFNGFPLLTFDSTPDQMYKLLIKRVIDIFLSGVALILLLPVFIIVAILIKTTSQGTLFFKQLRCGLNHRKFTLYKFRTMVDGAENTLDRLLSSNELKGPAFKLRNDPRLTKVGKFLRKTSLDELPQFWNVFKGDMSIVGPRPPIPREVNAYESWHRRRLSMKPGITCLWQVNGRNQIKDFNQWIKMDLDYIDHWSLSLDYKIMLKTIPVVLFGIGAE